MQTKSWINNKDVFGNAGPATEDHIWPLANNGSRSSLNIQLLTRQSNLEKGDRNKGKINGIRFSITEIGRTESGKIIGRMKAFKNGNWIDVK